MTENEKKTSPAEGAAIVTFIVATILFGFWALFYATTPESAADHEKKTEIKHSTPASDTNTLDLLHYTPPSQSVIVEPEKPRDYLKYIPDRDEIATKAARLQIWKMRDDGSCYAMILVTGWEPIRIDVSGFVCEPPPPTVVKPTENTNEPKLYDEHGVAVGRTK